MSERGPTIAPCAPSARLDGAGRPACLLIHGFTGAPHDMRPVADALYARGLPVQVMRLPGHCADPAALNATSRHDWVRAVEAAATELHARFGPIMVVGLSMGGLLALRLAAKRPDLVDRLVTMGAPTRLPRLSRVALSVYRALGRPSRMRVVPKPRRRARKEAYFTFDASHGCYPMDASLELDVLREEVRGILPSIRQPILVLHGGKDPTAPIASAFEIVEQVASTHNRLVVLRGSHHVLSMDVDREQLFDEICHFALAGGA